MSNFVSGVIGAAALVVSLGAAQFAVGHDLPGLTAKVAAASQSDHVNRSAKADRPSGIAVVPGRVMQTSGSDGSSVVTRVFRPSLLREGKIGKIDEKVRARPVACEAPASVLTDVAKHLESGRCLT